MPKTVSDLPNALTDEGLRQRLASGQPAVFLDYDGVLTPIVDRPQDAILSQPMRDAVTELSHRCPVCIITGRDRATVQGLMDIDDLVVAGSHGFDIWSPTRGTLTHPKSTGVHELISQATWRLRDRLGNIDGVLIEAKAASVAVHYRMVAKPDRDTVKRAVKDLVAEDPEALKIMPGKKVYEVEPNIDWHKGSAVDYLLHVLELDRPGVVPIYLGDDITDENAFRTLEGRGVSILVGHADDPETAQRNTAADYALASTDDVRTFLNSLAQPSNS